MGQGEAEHCKYFGGYRLYRKYSARSCEFIFLNAYSKLLYSLDKLQRRTFMKSLSNLRKPKTLRHAIYAALTAGSVAVAGPAFGDGKVTYDPADKTVHIPTVHVGTDQYEAKMKREETGDGLFKFVITELSMVSKLTFEDTENPGFKKTLTLTEIVAKLPAKDIEIYDPTENRNKTFRGVPTNELLDLVYGEDWRNREEMATVALDGYRSSLPIDRYLKYDSYVAFEDVNRPQFILVKAEDGRYVELGPFWLVWDNITFPELKASVSYGWPWQQVGFKLASFADLFANSAPPEDSPENVKQGFLEAREFCMSCHKVNGDGGKIGGELIENGVVEKTDDRRMKDLILDIDITLTAFPNASGMVLRSELPNREQIADNIIAYLNAMDANK
jgi:hypothetical protein